MVNPFRTGANRAAASGARPKPLSNPGKPWVHRPVERKPNNDNHPWRRHKPKTPFKPFGGRKPKAPPFGRRIPGAPGAGTRWGRRLWRAGPWIDVATVAVGILWAERSSAPFYNFAGWTQVCSQAGPRQAIGWGPNQNFSPLCGIGGQAYFNEVGAMIPANMRTVYIGQITNPTTHRAKWLEQWTRPLGNGALKPLPLWIPIDPDVKPWSPILPDWWPDHPVIHPKAHPQPRPEPHGDPNPQPRTQPQPAKPVVVLPGGVVPSITISSGNPQPHISTHVKQPPLKPREREKKKRLKPTTSARWAALLLRGFGSFMEYDDFIAAIYKGLPWDKRRWRGEDGVWRDRDYTTAGRAERIWNLLGSLNVEKAIEEVVKNEAQDRFFGSVGNVFKKAARDSGHWQSVAGFQVGGSNRRNMDWERQKKAAQENFAREHRNQFYAVRVQKADGSWETQYRLRPVTQIPWLRKKSQYQRLDYPSASDWWRMSYPEKEQWLQSMDKYYALTAAERRDLLTGRRDPDSIGLGLRDAYYYEGG